MTELNQKTPDTGINKKFKKLAVPIIGLGLLLVIGVIMISLNPDILKNISQKTNITPSSSTSQNNQKSEVKKTTYTYGDFPDFRLVYPTDWQIGGISTTQFSLTKQNTKAIVTLESPSVGGLIGVGCNTNTVKVSDKITRVLPIGRSEHIYLPTSSIHLKGEQKFDDIFKSIDLSKADQNQKNGYAKADSCGAELYTSLTKTKLPVNAGINSPEGQGWFRMTVSGDNQELFKELDSIVNEVSGLYWE